jgi:hypothetical protein
MTRRVLYGTGQLDDWTTVRRVDVARRELTKGSFTACVIDQGNKVADQLIIQVYDSTCSISINRTLTSIAQLAPKLHQPSSPFRLEPRIQL